MHIVDRSAHKYDLEVEHHQSTCEIRSYDLEAEWISRSIWDAEAIARNAGADWCIFWGKTAKV